MDRAEALHLLSTARLAHLATTRPDRKPHVVPVTFTLLGGSVVTSIDQKPKTSRRLQRLVNIEAHPHVSLLADHYEEDWRRLWWVRVDGLASIRTRHDQALDAFASKYEQYAERPPQGPFIVIEMDQVRWWAGTP